MWHNEQNLEVTVELKELRSVVWGKGILADQGERSPMKLTQN